MSLTGRERLEDFFPRLTTANYRITSEETADYNCVAWAAGDSGDWWEPTQPPDPNYHWPDGAVRADTIDALVSAYATLGFEICPDGTPEVGFLKLAVYGQDGTYTHVARQVGGGMWASKLGVFEDIEHESLEALTGDDYGDVVLFMRRPVN